MSFHLSELSTGSVGPISQANNQSTKSSQVNPSEQLTKTMMKQMKASEKFDIELEDSGYYQADKIINEINFLSAKVSGYSKSSGITDFYSSRNSAENAEIDDNCECSFQPIRGSPKRISASNSPRFNVPGTSQFREPHIYPKVDLNQNQSIDDEWIPSYQFFRATPPRRPPK